MDIVTDVIALIGNEIFDGKSNIEEIEYELINGGKQVVFAVDSDLHFENVNGIRPDKANNVQNIINNGDIKFTIVCGDITNTGYDGKKFLCWQYGGTEDEFGTFVRDYYQPIKNKMPIYFCAGNHDTYVPWPYLHKPVFKFITDTYGALRYSFDVEDLHFICCHIYPDEDGLEFLRSDLEKNKDKHTVIFFHYNMIGEMSTWWAFDKEEDVKITEERQEKFYEVIKDYHIAGILCGHLHESNTYKWKDINVFCVGGSGYTICTFADGILTATFNN